MQAVVVELLAFLIAERALLLIFARLAVDEGGVAGFAQRRTRQELALDVRVG
jgi:hypothetical protein